MSDPALTIDDLRAEVARLQDLADARLYRARAAQVTLESVGIPRSEPVDVSAGRAAGMIEDLRAEVARLTAALAAAQPVVEWCTRIDVEEATVGAFALLVESDGWRLEVSDGTGDYWIVDSGDETGPAGKSAAEAAYRRACGFPPQAAPVAPQVVRLHQAYEGTTVCLHCGEPMPWSEMEVCPRAPKDLRA